MLRLVILSLVLGLTVADVYLHGTIRGSNNRNCRNDNNDRRRNGNRLFDSQNNDKGGYSCPRAYPFDNANDQATVDRFGKLQTSDALDTETYYVYAGSWVNLEWTNQHGAGPNPNMYGQGIWQYMTNDEDAGGNEMLRDGTPINNNDGNNNNDEATGTITAATERDGRFGYHETLASYETCETTERNKGLFIADQDLDGDSAIYTRQNPDGDTYGFECAEERDYYPYWRPSAWHDIAIYTKDVDRCEEKIAPQSQNVVEKCWCELDNPSTNNLAPINEEGCDSKNGEWRCQAPWNTQRKCGFAGKTWSCDEQPACLAAKFSRDNHLGNQLDEVSNLDDADDETVSPATFRWLVPEFLEETKVVLRLRYNISTYDFDMDTTDSRFNGDNSPVIDRDNREDESYYDIGLTPDGGNVDHYKLGLAVNTNQYARTFQDRTYVFIVKPLPDELADCRGRILNVGMRGKRGNIVQTYPSVEYDFSPQKLDVAQDDCLHFQWIGSDYNPNRNPNNGEGGPPNPNNQNEAKADRTNLVQFSSSGLNQPMHADNMENGDCFFKNDDGECDWAMYRRMAYIDMDMSTCLSSEELRNRGVNGRQQRERDARNCGKLSAARTPHFDGGVYKVKADQGDYTFFSTRNNNFSNRSQKLQIKVTPPRDSGKLSSGEVAGVVIGSLLAAGLAGFVGLNLRKWHTQRSGGPASVSNPGFKQKFMASRTPATAKPAV